MASTLNNVTTADQYTAAATLQAPAVVQIVLDISNAAVFYQIKEPVEGLAEGAWNWGEEKFAPPTFQTLRRRTAGIRFRSAKAGTPAQVSAQLLTSIDLGGG